MWETAIAGAGGLMGLYVSLRKEVRRSHELLHKDFVHMAERLDRLDGRIDRSEGRVDGRLEHLESHLETGLSEVRADLRRLDEKIDAVRGELIGFLGDS